jgi:hypothetical protein
MCSDPQDHSQELSEDQNVEGGLCSSLEESKGGNFLVAIRPALWALHGRNRVRVHLPLSRPQSVVLDRWAQGLSVMLQKLFGCSLITKLRAILLMEANLNCSKKTVFGIRMLDEARRQNLMPEEVFSKRNKMADDGTLTKVLTYDIIRQTR